MAAEEKVLLRAEDFDGQEAASRLLRQVIPAGGMPHAVLLSGIRGVGKRSLAELISRTLLCTGRDKPCGECPACRQLAADTHPDRTVIRPGEPLSPKGEKGKKNIPVDDIREAVRILSAHAYEGVGRVLVIEQAEQMNGNAQNALLKTLEEPPQDTWILLLSDSPGQLLPTIRSRCWLLRLNPWPEEKVAEILRRRGAEPEKIAECARICGGSPGRALEIAADSEYWARRGRLMKDFFSLRARSEILAVSGTWKDDKDQAAEMLDELEQMVSLLMKVRLGQADPALIREYPEEWRRAAAEGEIRGWMRLADAITRARLLRQNQVTWQAVVERLLLDFMEVKSRW
ncbi:MAG: DNA polymerase III subunit delta' [Clostridia bacterium]|nr:DNA polymerase III subunit delta' [Clostridia bacterium]